MIGSLFITQFINKDIVKKAALFSIVKSMKILCYMEFHLYHIFDSYAFEIFSMDDCFWETVNCAVLK